MQRPIIKPSRLSEASTVAVLAPSSNFADRFPAVYAAGIDALENTLGFAVREFPTASMTAAELYADPERRAQDLNDAFADPAVDGIVTVIGGDESVRILPFLDAAVALANPKVLIGYSDITAISTFYSNHGLVTFHGPTVMSGLAQLPSLPTAATEVLRALLCTDSDGYAMPRFDHYSDGYPDWSRAENATAVTTPLPDKGWRVLQEGGRVATGCLWGGCIEVLEFLKATDWWPSRPSWNQKLVFFETSEDKPSVEQVQYWLRNYGSQGIFDQISGVMFGRARDYDEREKAELDDAIVSVIVGEFGADQLPIVSNVSIGHTDPQWVLPIGVEAQLDMANRTLRLCESATVAP